MTNLIDFKFIKSVIYFSNKLLGILGSSKNQYEQAWLPTLAATVAKAVKIVAKNFKIIPPSLFIFYLQINCDQNYNSCNYQTSL